jgi:pimeloyl-ACP methyl ester carboxylesterase
MTRESRLWRPALALLVTAGCALAAAACVPEDVTEAAMVLEDIAAGASQSRLKGATPAPTRFEIGYQEGGRAGRGDLYRPNQPVGGNLVLVPGFSPHGKDDRRVVEFAQSFARARFRVLVPEVPGSRQMRVGPEDARVIADAAVYLIAKFPLEGTARTALMAISYAVGPTILATLDPRLKGKVSFVAGIGGYHDTAAVTTFVTTGHFRDPGTAEWRTLPPHPAAKWLFLKTNLDLLSAAHDRAALAEIAGRKARQPSASTADLARRLGPEGRALYDLIENTSPARVPGLIAALPATVRDRMDDISLAGRNLGHLEGRLILIHGREDTMIPYTESMALANAVPATELFLIDGFSHIDPASVGLTGRLQLVRALGAVLDRRTAVAPD